MKILLEEENGHLVMSVGYEDDPMWDASVTDMAAELDHRQGVRRVGYDTWHWDLRRQQEAEEYITYFILKHQ